MKLTRNYPNRHKEQIVLVIRFESDISEITAKNKPTSEQIEFIEYYADKYSKRLAEAKRKG